MHISSQADSLIGTFSELDDVTPEMVMNLRSAIASSPLLVDAINQSVSEGHLRSLSPAHHSMHAGAQYDGQSKSVRISPSLLSADKNGTFSKEEVIFVLAHEVQHGFNYPAKAKALSEFEHRAKSEAKSKVLTHDYTAIIGDLLAANRRDEAIAEIAGWNAVVSSIRSKNPGADLKDIFESAVYRIQDFVDKSSSRDGTHSYSLKPNLVLKQDMSMEFTPSNVEAMSKNFFDRPPEQSNLGDLGNSNYATYYGVHAIEFCIAQERSNTRLFGESTKMRIDLEALGLSEKLLEEEGINLGRDKRPQPYIDGRQEQSLFRYFDHTQGGSNDHRYVPPPVQEPNANPQVDLFNRYLDALANGDRDALNHLRAEYISSRDGQQLAQEAAAFIQARHHEATTYVEYRGLAMNPDGPSFGTLTGRRDPRDWDHPDHALYSAIRRELPLQVPDEAAAHVMLQAKQARILAPHDLDSVAVRDGRAFVAGKHLQFAHADLSQDPPPMRETVRQSEMLDQQMAQERVQWLAQQQELARSGPSMSR
ncbi:MAG TPA: hypothetical protein VJ806_04460 [Luteimonas sp.]|nr:hypothetical protein [Luteimonas sp.]